MEKEIDKFSQQIDEVRGEIIPDWDWPMGCIDEFFNSFHKIPTIAELGETKI